MRPTRPYYFARCRAIGAALILACGLLLVLFSAGTVPPTYSEVQSDTAIKYEILDEIAKDTWIYLSSDWATQNHLPYSWRSQTISGGDFSNSAEIGLLALSWIGAYEMQESWSPSWGDTETEISAILDQLRAWQTGSQTYQPHGPNVYSDTLFFQWYWINWNPPVVGANTGLNQLVPSIDNAWLVASLITIREYGAAHGHITLAQKADDILTDIDFSLWYNDSTDRFYWGDVRDPAAGLVADYYSNENRLINFIAQVQGDLSPAEFDASINALTAPTIAYQGITVTHTAWDGSLFTYLSPALFIREAETDYGPETLIPVIDAQIAYAAAEGYAAWGFSDCFDVGSGGYLQAGAPPAASPNPLEDNPGMVTPSMSFLTLQTTRAMAAISNVQKISATLPVAYDDQYGFLDCVQANPADGDFGQPSDRFSALAQLWTFLGIANHQTLFIHDYFYRANVVKAAHEAMFDQPVITDTAFVKSMWVWDEKVITDPAERTRLIDFSSQQQIESLFLNSGSLINNNQAELGTMAAELAANNMSFELLGGEPQWALSSNHAEAIAFVSQAISFTENLTPTQRPVAIHLDIEPYLLPEWQNDPAGTMGQYLNGLASIKQEIANSGTPLILVVDMPFWFDTVRVDYGGKLKPLNQHVQDIADRVVLMDYRDFTSGRDGSLVHAYNELVYASTIGKQIVIGLETRRPDGQPEKITYYEEGSAALEADIGLLRLHYGQNPAFSGVAIHDYDGLYLLNLEQKLHLPAIQRK